ncbi:hypothetical protein IMY05_007G0033000 [Salix suchowensis]|nr:hypothetical protein IMY05_007G0033000 [Salix suchowensis]
MLADCCSPQAGIEEGERKTRLSKVTKMSLKQESLVLFIAIITVFIAATSTTLELRSSTAAIVNLLVELGNMLMLSHTLLASQMDAPSF